MLYPISYKRERRKRKIKSNKKRSYIFIIIVYTIIILFIIFILKLFIFPNNSIFFTKKINRFDINSKKYKYYNYNKKEIIDDYLSSIPPKFQKYIERERNLLEKYLNLKDLSKEITEKEKTDAKDKVLDHFLSLLTKNNSNDIKYIYLTDNSQFGNRIIILNNLIYYCEILGFKNIYLNSNVNWYIKDKIISDNINITMIPSINIDCQSPYIACFKNVKDTTLFLFFPSYIKPKIRLNLIKNEIKKNLPQVEINQNDLYIHIRSGDVFRPGIRTDYAQPPLCFYQNIINNFKFKNIYIIAENKNNPLIDKILEQFPNIIYNRHDLSIDMAYLSNAYNLVASVSSFLLVLVKFNDNLKKYFEYDIYKISEKFIQLHHDFYYFPMNFTIYRMKPSIRYKNEMFRFFFEDSQCKLMIDEKCVNKLTIIEPNV